MSMIRESAYLKNEVLKEMEAFPCIGIDLGTCYCCIGVYEKGEIKVVSDNGKRTFPSYYGIRKGMSIYGYMAKARSIFNPQSVVYDAKRMIGRGYSEVIKEKEENNWKFELKEDADDRIYYVIHDNEDTYELSPEMVSGFILNYMKDLAESYLKLEVSHCVITVPAFFTDSQRAATKIAAEAAGLDLLDIINEPSAAAFAYSIAQEITAEYVLVYDLGGGTFDVSLLTVHGNESSVIGSSGNNRLGGQDFDNRLIRYLQQQYNTQYHYIPASERELQILRQEAESAKITLSGSTRCSIDITEIRDINFHIDITRDDFTNLNVDYFNKTINICCDLLNDNKVLNDQIGAIILVGGSSRIPRISELLQNRFSRAQILNTVDCDEVVARGAVMVAANRWFTKRGIAYQPFPSPVRDTVVRTCGVSQDRKTVIPILKRGTPSGQSMSQVITVNRFFNSSQTFYVVQGESTVYSDCIDCGTVTIKGLKKLFLFRSTIQVEMSMDQFGCLTVIVSDVNGTAHESLSIEGLRDMKNSDIKKLKSIISHDREILQAKKEKEELLTVFSSEIQDVRDTIKGKEMNRIRLMAVSNKIKDASSWIERNMNASVAEIEKQRQLFRSGVSACL